MVSQDVLQTFSPYLEATTVEGTTQTLALGPVASQEAIKMFGTNGGGVFNANSAHPFENPTPLTNFLQMVLIFAIPAALTYTYRRMAQNQKQGWVLFDAMSVLFFVGVVIAYSPTAERPVCISSAQTHVRNARLSIPSSFLSEGPPGGTDNTGEHRL